MALNATNYQFKLVEAASAESVSYAAGQLIVTDSGQTYYDPSTGTSTTNRITLVPDLAAYLLKTFAEKVVTGISFDNATDAGVVQVTIQTVNPSTGATNSESTSFKSYTASETPTANDKKPITSDAVKKIYDELKAEINKKQSTLTAGEGITLQEDSGIIIDVKVDPKSGNLLKKSTAGLLVEAPESTDYTVTIEESTASQEYAKVYTVKQAASGLNATINIPKDMVVSDGSVQTFQAGSLPSGVSEAGTYVVLTLANANDKKIYINVSDLVDAIKTEDSDHITLTATSANKVTTLKATIKAGSITETELAKAVTDKLAKAASAVQDVTLGSGSNNGTLKLTVDGEETDNIAVKGLQAGAFTDVQTGTLAETGNKLTTEKVVADYVKSMLTVYRAQ